MVKATDPKLTLHDMLEALSKDMHQASTRGCQTCYDITNKLGWPFGCYEYHALRKSRSEWRASMEQASPR